MTLGTTKRSDSSRLFLLVSLICILCKSVVNAQSFQLFITLRSLFLELICLIATFFPSLGTYCSETDPLTLDPLVTIKPLETPTISPSVNSSFAPSSNLRAGQTFPVESMSELNAIITSPTLSPVYRSSFRESSEDILVTAAKCADIPQYIDPVTYPSISENPYPAGYLVNVLGIKLSPELEIWPILLSIIFIICSFMLLISQINCYFVRRREGKVDIDNETVSSSVNGSQDINEESNNAQGKNKAGKALISWNKICCSYGSGDQRKVIFENVSGVMKSGELTAFMGPSGCGKSTLLDIIAGKKNLGNLSGDISILGENFVTREKNCSLMLSNTAFYIPQEVIFFPYQHPEEAVAFFADIKFGKDPQGEKSRRKKVREILLEVGLEKESFRRPIGGRLPGGITIRGLSGGQKKRLALACALVVEPKLLFLDEITSGLDSENTLNVIQLLSRVCVSRNVAAAVVIHQPSYDVFRSFDRLVLLSRGKCIFSDVTENLPSLYQDVFNKAMPEAYRICDDFLREASKSFQDVPLKTVNKLEQTENIFRKTYDFEEPSHFWKFLCVFRRNLTCHYIRNVTNLLARFVLYCALSFLLGVIFWNVGTSSDASGYLSTQTEISAAVGAILLQINCSVLLPFAMISQFSSDKVFFIAESSMGLYSPWIFCIVQVVLEFWALTLTSVFFALIWIPMFNIINPALPQIVSYLTYVCLTILSSMLGNVVILFNAYLLPSSDVAFITGAALNVLYLATCGGYMPLPLMTKYIKWFQWINPLKYSLQGFLIAAFQGTPTELFLMTVELNQPSSVTSNMLVLIGFMIAYIIGSMMALATKKESR